MAATHAAPTPAATIIDATMTTGLQSCWRCTPTPSAALDEGAAAAAWCRDDGPVGRWCSLEPLVSLLAPPLPPMGLNGSTGNSSADAGSGIEFCGD